MPVIAQTVCPFHLLLPRQGAANYRSSCAHGDSFEGLKVKGGLAALAWKGEGARSTEYGARSTEHGARRTKDEGRRTKDRGLYQTSEEVELNGSLGSNKQSVLLLHRAATSHQHSTRSCLDPRCPKNSDAHAWTRGDPSTNMLLPGPEVTQALDTLLPGPGAIKALDTLLPGPGVTNALVTFLPEPAVNPSQNIQHTQPGDDSFPSYWDEIGVLASRVPLWLTVTP